MIQVYIAQHPTEAYIVKGILESYGIESQVRGDILFSARGEIPLTIDTAPSVWIVDQEDQKEADMIIRNYEKNINNRNSSQPDWLCSNCGEASEAQFTECWNCGFPRNTINSL